LPSNLTPLKVAAPWNVTPVKLAALSKLADAERTSFGNTKPPNL
jgi:hypothetical protein